MNRGRSAGPHILAAAQGRYVTAAAAQGRNVTAAAAQGGNVTAAEPIYTKTLQKK